MSYYRSPVSWPTINNNAPPVPIIPDSQVALNPVEAVVPSRPTTSHDQAGGGATTYVYCKDYTVLGNWWRVQNRARCCNDLGGRFVQECCSESKTASLPYHVKFDFTYFNNQCTPTTLFVTSECLGTAGGSTSSSPIAMTKQQAAECCNAASDRATYRKNCCTKNQPFFDLEYDEEAKICKAAATKGGGGGGSNRGAASTSWTLQDIIDALENVGNYTVLQGSLERGNAQRAYDEGSLPDANGNHVGQYYSVAAIPPAPGEAISSLQTTTRSGQQTLNVAYRMRPDEAMVYVGATPPAVDTFSIRSHVMYRFFPERSRTEKFFNSLGDTLNMQRNFAHIEGTRVPIVVVSVASKETLVRVKEALVTPGGTGLVQNNRFFVDRIPLSLVNLGLDFDKDQLTIVHRYGNADNSTELGRFLSNRRGQSGTYLRLTPKDTDDSQGAALINDHVPDRLRFPYTVLSRDTPKDATRVGDAYEVNLYYGGFLNLRRRILRRWIDAGYNPTEYQSSIFLTEGVDGIQRGVDLLGENRDTTCIRSESFTLARDEIAVIYGVHHSRANKTIHNSWSVYQDDVLSGVIGKNSAKEDFAGGAAAYLAVEQDGNNPQQQQADPENYYVWHLRRAGRGADDDDDPDYFMTVPSQLKYYTTSSRDATLSSSNPFLLTNGAEHIPLANRLFVGFQYHVNPVTGLGPSLNEIVYDRVIKMTPS